ncbi:MAG: ParB/RepB/Spo0J family partition protein [Gemmatimonadota bacterium]|nr:ParB/RepB/Spo0J family partition protein [Gemmatimonadota bacterium]
MKAQAKPRLGRGLSALLGEYLPEESASPQGVRVVDPAAIVANPFQPRREFAPEALAELEGSIRENGLLQPLVVRPAPTGEGREAGAQWELVAGERRLRAIRRLQWTEVPVVVREIDDRAMLVLAIVENVQRAGLSPLEEAAGYRQLIDEFGFTQAEVADSVGRERSTVANLLRLLQLPASVRRMLNEGKLAMGHARALLGLGDERGMAELAREAAAEGLSVRSVEERVRRRQSRGSASTAQRASAAHDGSDAHLRHLEAELQRRMGSRVRIRTEARDRGRVEIPFFSGEDFERIVELLLGSEAER